MSKIQPGYSPVIAAKNHDNTKISRLLADRRLWLILAAALLRMGFYGFRYFPQLDDYIQYGSYPTAEQPFTQIYLTLGLFAARPLAGLFDLYLWGRFWNNMGVVLLVMTLLHGLSAWLFLRLAERLDYRVGLLFAAIFLLCPLQFEATYWISASSRLVIPVFFAAIALHLQVSRQYGMFATLQLLSLLFHEQVLVFSLLLSLLIAWKRRDLRGGFITCANGLMVVLYYVFLATAGRFGNRSGLQIFNWNTLHAIAQSWSAHWYAAALQKGVLRGGVWFTLSALCIGSCFCMGKRRFCAPLLWVGAVITLLCYLPLLILQNPTIALRGAFVPLIGVALMADSLLSLLPGKGAITAAVAVCFLCIAPGELGDYRDNYLADQRVVAWVAANTQPGVPNLVQGGTRYHAGTSFPFAQHIERVTSSDWALTGAVRAYKKDRRLPYYYLDADGLDEYHLITLP